MKKIEWSEYYGVGKIVCSCDACSSTEEFEFEDNKPDFAGAQKELRKMGWTSLKNNGKWYDFCSEKCRNKFIKEN